MIAAFPELHGAEFHAQLTAILAVKFQFKGTVFPMEQAVENRIRRIKLKINTVVNGMFIDGDEMIPGFYSHIFSKAVFAESLNDEP